MHERNSQPPAPDIVALVLAAGQGSRFNDSGCRYKPVAPLADGTPMIYAVCHTLLQHVADITVVCGPNERSVRDALKGLPVNIVHCADAHDGMSASLRYGVRQSPTRIGWIVALADMPFIRADTVQAIAARLHQGGRIVRPQFNDRLGHPVGFSCEFEDELLAVAGDEGARSIIRRHPDAVTLLPVEDPGCLIDIDTEEQLQQYGKDSRLFAKQ